jgi:hypothetical protein
MQRTNIYLDERQCALLDELAASEGVSRAELIRRFIDRALAGKDEDLARDLAAIEGSFGVLADMKPPGREPDARAGHLDRLWRMNT